MDQLEQGQGISVTGALRRDALERSSAQISQWNLAMPNIDPLVFDFGLGDFDRIGEVEYWIANEVEAGYCGKFLFLFQGQMCPEHYHRMKLETFFIQRGQVRMNCDGKSWVMQEGDVWRMAPGVKHSFASEGGPALILEVSKPCIIADNYFTDTRIPIGSNYQPI